MPGEAESKADDQQQPESESEAPASAPAAADRAGAIDETGLDLITLIQKRVIEQSATLFNFLGSLQQRAPPQPVLVDSLVREQAADEEWAAVRALPDVILSQMDGIRELAEQLPEDPAQTREEPEDVDAIVALISENHALDAQLADELERAEARLHSGLALTDALGKHELRVRDLTPPER